MSVRNRSYAAIALLFGLAGLIAWFVASRSKSNPTTLPEPAPRSARTLSTPLVGTPSCSARGCHGSIEPGIEPDRCQQNEYMQWMRDPHADAYRTLFSERSQTIARLLGGGKKAHEDSRCLACHVNPQVASLDQQTAFVHQERLFGVGCESCHGNATSWLTAHTAPDWRQKKSSHTMPDLTDPAVAAKKCAGCHVGAPPDETNPLRDVNHDLIAAGHPRLHFEFGSFLANMPPHWRTRPTSDGRLWAVGQVVSAQASLDLLAHRAQSGPWPEFAEYDCFACHHSLTNPSWRQAERRQGKPGALPWGTWYFAMPRELGGDLPALAALQQQMQKAIPDRAQTAANAKAARPELNDLLGRSTDALARQRVLDRFRTGASKLDPSWDAAEQMYLALYALNPSPALQGLATERAFAAGSDSPRPPFHAQHFLQKLRGLAR